MCALAEEAAAILEKDGISTAVINPRWIKPLDAATIEFFARSVDVVATIEDHVLHNGAAGETPSASAMLSKQEIDSFHRDGYLVVDQISDPAEVLELRQIYDEPFARRAGRE
jgi:transketolase C-terminal domain/subunit